MTVFSYLKRNSEVWNKDPDNSKDGGELGWGVKPEK